MKIISLNIYHGFEKDNLLDFIATESTSTDIFCFQEINNNPQNDLTKLKERGTPNILKFISEVLPNFSYEYSPSSFKYFKPENYQGEISTGLAIFYKSNLKPLQKKSFDIYQTSPEDIENESAGNASLIEFSNPKPFTVITAHGAAHPAHKLDTPKRIKQSQIIIDEAQKTTSPKIIIGDFNLFPETKSIQLFTKNGYRDLISDFSITTTRGTHMRKLFPEYENGKYGFQEFADYTFTSPEIKINSFEVPDLPLSDHLPMILNFEL